MRVASTRRCFAQWRLRRVRHHWSTSADRRRSSRRSRPRSSRWATNPRASGPSDSDRQEAEMDALKLDGNAAAGLLQQVFAVEAVGAVVVYAHAPGTVLRCPHCDAVLMRIVTDGARYWVDLRGVRSLELTST